MKKRSLALTLATAVALLAFSSPAQAEEDAADKGKPTGKHNFEQWQTIKRLEIRN